MATINWRRLSAWTAFLLVAIISFSIIYEPEPRVTVFSQATVSESIGWETYRMDVTHQGIAPLDCTVGAGLIPEWRTKRLNRGEYSASKSSPAVDDETLYIGLDTRTLVAVDRLTGRVKWSFFTRFSKNGIHGSPTIDPDRNLVYIGAYDGWLYALNRETGKRVWDAKLGDYIGSSPTLYNGTVYIGVEMRAPDGYIVGVDADTGVEVYRSGKLGNHPHSTPTIDPESGCVFIGENNGVLHCYWIVNQTERWSFKTGGDIKSTAAVSGGVVYISSWSGGLYAIDISSGISIWTHSGGYSSMSSPTIDPENGFIYYGNHGGSFYAVNASTGDAVWTYQTGGKILSSPTLVKRTNTVIIGSNDGVIYLLDAETGSLKQRLMLVSGLTGVPVAVGERLYAFDHLGYLYSFRMG
jgi:outer membrane protein assembly factor BamB